MAGPAGSAEREGLDKAVGPPSGVTSLPRAFSVLALQVPTSQETVRS